MWDHNLNELRKLDMLGSVRELRIVMYNGCRRNLNLDILLEILHIINLPNWTIFRRNNKKALWFQNLKKLAFEFDKPDKNPKEIDEADSKDKDEDKPREKAEFPIIVKFDGKMRVAAKGVGNTIMALQNYFKNGQHSPMVLVDEPKRLQLTPLLVEETSVLILLSQLWNLQVLTIDAFAMERHHLSVPEAGNHFADHRASLRWFDAAYRDFEKAKERNGGFSHPLVRLHIRSRKRLDISAVVSLVSYLPSLVELGVVREMISEVAMAIGGRALGQPEERFQAIKVCEFSMHDAEIDG
ncbi:hypothetical protein FBU59_003373 [Linderina macrospora]|uniref:Uncharacterized protein n=1 Tax=Linderina macrospora TaxID=4868 RepID=A0ACC1J8N2_9FUNG|nr:hypothetical protein FBU59_003373 [Linderina macrospora]